jgi:hypothetical protein
MRARFKHFAWFLAVLVLGQPFRAAAGDADGRLYAGWKVEQEDGLGDAYYLYPDGLFVRQGVRRREFVTIGHWKQEDQKRLVLLDQRLRNTTFSAERLDEIRKKEVRYTLVFDSDNTMRWIPAESDSRATVLKRLRDLPDRTENIYWGLGTDESYRRALLREMGRTLSEEKKSEANQAREATATAVMPAAGQEVAPAALAACLQR